MQQSQNNKIQNMLGNYVTYNGKKKKNFLKGILILQFPVKTLLVFQ